MQALLGQPIDRRDGRLKVTGRARYAAEFPAENLAHAALVGSTIGAGSIAAFDLGAAQKMPGVLAIITPDNAPKLATDTKNTHIITAPLLQDGNVVFNGQPIAVVVADTLERALAAAAAVRVTYHQGEPSTDMAARLDQAYVPKNFRDGAHPPDSSRGDPDGAFNAAPVKLEVTYETPVEHHNPMEPHATLARWDGDRLTVWTATQGISPAHASFATLFKVDPTQMRVICPYVGGGFGCKGTTWPPATLAALAARVVGRPVRLVLTRAQMYTNNGYRPATIQKLRLAAGNDGKLLAIRHDGITSMSQPSLGEFAEPVGLATEMLYACQNVAITHRLVALNAPLPTYMRAPGEASGVYALEAAMDELAAQLKLDPLELRLRNYAETDPSDNRPFASKVLRACYQQGAAAFGWASRPLQPGTLRDGRDLVGLGMATATYPTNRMPASATVRLRADGSAIVQCGTQDIGTGTYTVLAQLGADELGLPMHRVRVELGDSSLPPAPVSGGSMTIASVTPAVLAACVAARQALFDMALADPRFAGANQQHASLVLRDGIVSGAGTQLRVAEIMARHGVSEVVGSADAKPGDEKTRFSMHAFGAQFIEVRIDADLGHIRVARALGAFDCGRIMNAKLARSQLIGGITYGIGMALLEQTNIDGDTGRVTNANLADYLVPVNADIPDIQTIIVENDEHNSNPLGAKGIGELPMVGVAAAVANAVWHATGRRVRKVPIRIEDVL